MPTQYTGYSYPYPQPVDPVRDGAVNIQALAASIMPNAQAFPGQGPLAGSFAAADYPKIRCYYYNYRLGTDQYGLVTMSTGFTKCLLTAWCTPRDFRLDVGVPVIAEEGMTTVGQVTWYFSKRTDGQGVGNTYINVTAAVLGL